MASASFDIGATLVCLTCLVYMMVRRRYDKLQSKVLIAIIVDAAITAASNAAAAIIRATAVADAASSAAIEAVGFIYFVSHTALAPLFALYVLAVCRISAERNRPLDAAMGLPFIAMELLVITNPITHWVYTYGPDLSFSRGWGDYVLYIGGGIYLVMAFVWLIARWRALTSAKRRAMTYFFLMASAGVLVQLVAPAIRIELFAESLAILGIIMFVENEDELIDSETGVYNRRALKMDLDAYAGLKRPYYIVGVRVSNVDVFTRLDKAILTANALAEMLAGYFKSVVPWYRVYRTAPNRFVIVDPSMDESRASNLAQTIAGRFECGWAHADTDIDLHAVVALACVPTDLPSSDDVFYLMDTPVPSVEDGTVLQGEGLNYLVRRAEVERAVQRGFEENSYEVYFQPVICADGTVRAAEALMRLTDSVLGSVSPNEFIDVAERLALVRNIGDFALRQVCEFLQSGTPERLGIEDINVNLSVIECMQADFGTRVESVVAEYGIDPSTVGFEITESVAASDNGLLSSVMSQLKGNGHRLAMDDFGTGYSNMHSLLTFDFDVVKIDKDVLWEAEKSDVGMVILETSVDMLHNAGCKVLVEGVETESQLELLRRLNVDFYQGFFFAEPMSKAEFVTYVEQHRA